MGEKLKSATNGREFLWLQGVRSTDFDSIGVEVRKWGTSGVKFQNEKYTLLLAEGLQFWIAVLFLRRFYDIIKLIETS